MNQLKATLTLAAASLLAACGGGGGEASTGGTGGVSTITQGAYSGGITGSSSSQFQLLALENGDVWALYGVPSGNQFLVRGFVQGTAVQTGGTFNGSIKDFGFNPAVAGTISGSITSASVSGSLAENGATATFSGSPIPTSSYDYNAAASLSQIAGAWTLTGLDGTATTVNIASNGAFTGNNAGCVISGTITPRASGKNVFDVSVTNGAAPCAPPGTTSTGVAVTFLVSGTTIRELMVVGTNAARTAGNAFFGFR